MRTAILLLLTLLTAAPAVAQSCSTKKADSKAERALDAIHAVRAGSSKADCERVVAELLPFVLELEQARDPEAAWLHVGVDVARELVKLDRRADAKHLLQLVARLDGDREWGRKAAEHLKMMGE